MINPTSTPRAKKPRIQVREKPAKTVASKVEAPRIVIDSVWPNLDNGAFAPKRTLGERQIVRAVLLCDGHEMLKGNLLYRHSSDRAWRKVPLVDQTNDIWQADLTPDRLGTYFYTVEAALDVYSKWHHDMTVKIQAGVATNLDVEQGIALLQSWKKSLKSEEQEFIQKKIQELDKAKLDTDRGTVLVVLNDRRLETIAHGIWSTSHVKYPKSLPLMVEPELARFSAWYEFFPRSFAKEEGRHGTFRDAARHLEYVADLGFDVVYLPPIHPIGEAFRKGRNNSLKAESGEPGSPWAIGGREGGHKAINPALGTMADFEKFVAKAEKLKIKIALDIAFQCSPDHPYVKEHADWFVRRPDGSIHYAENPPKKYEDIYPFDFHGAGREKLWKELKSVFLFWIEKGITVFRVDNPHTKPLPFWEWLIQDLKRAHPEVIFLSEAFTRPHIMNRLAKTGFSQSYTYFTWRTGKTEIMQYLEELKEPTLASYFRPNFWPNTPDILSGPLRNGNSAAFAARLILAATLSPIYGIYGPAYELQENAPRDDHSEEYLNSEKYEIKRWNLSDSKSLAPLIKKVNSIRRAEASLRSLENLRFHAVTNEHLIAYSHKSEGEAIILTVVNLDSNDKQLGMLEFSTDDFGLEAGEAFAAQDLLNGPVYSWSGSRHYIELDPAITSAHIFKILMNTENKRVADEP